MPSNFQNGILNYGVPVGLPPIAGQYFFVCPGSSSIIGYDGSQIVGSSGNTGTSPDQPLDSIATAYAKCVSGRGDGIVLMSYGTTTAASTSYLTEAITWSKWGITTVGMCAPTRINQRARIANKSTSLALANLITVSGSNNTFLNFSLFNGGTTGAGGVKVTGARNYFGNVHMMGGMGMTTPTVNDYSLYLDACEENTFVNCTIGSDTFDKTDIAGVEMKVGGMAARNRFYGCEFLTYRSAVTAVPGMIGLVGAGDSIVRDMVFDNCTFTYYDDGASTNVMASVVIGTAPNNGLIVFKDCLRICITDWGAAANARIMSGSATLHESGGIAIVSNPS